MPTDVIEVCAAVLNVPSSPVALTLPAVILPVTANAVKVPTDVIEVCAAVLNVPEIPVALTLAVVVMLPVNATKLPV